ncbi:MAG: hypothetical protein FWC89_08800 [Defluviitaleaceae bacterium]|nr:hypothetical protein [Defluviitaleaceae bacterium]
MPQISSPNEGYLSVAFRALRTKKDTTLSYPTSGSIQKKVTGLSAHKSIGTHTLSFALRRGIRF